MGVPDVSAEMQRLRREASQLKMLNLDQFRAAVRAGAFQPIFLRSGGIHFWIEGQPAPPSGPKPRSKEEKKTARELALEARMTLCTSRGKLPRRFRSPDAALKLLREMGAEKVEVQLESWYPQRSKSLGEVKRPDMAARLKGAHEAARVEALRRWQGEAVEE